MNILRFIIISLILLNFTLTKCEIIYKDPSENSKYVKISTGIILGFDKKLPFNNDMLKNDISLNGSKSGIHNFTYKISFDKKHILIDPVENFKYDEQVRVQISPNTDLKNAGVKNILQYTFRTEKAPVENSNTGKGNVEFYSENLFNNDYSFTPEELPHIDVIVDNSPAPGKIFLSNFPFGNLPNTPHLIIAENNGIIYTGLKTRASALDFKKQGNSLTFFDNYSSKFYQLNKDYNIIDSFYCGNGYKTDGHELRILANGNYLLMSYDEQTVDMSLIVNGGNPNCTVIGLIIQEIDRDRNVIFQWRSWDHIPITQTQHQDLAASEIDYVHGNAIEVDNDGNYLISSRHLDEITKINKNTGNIIWRLGGAENMFTFINDPDGFNYQHGIRRLPNGNIILFDNGNFHTPPHSRAVEYRLNEQSKTAELVWQYRNTPDNFGFAMGFAQRLENGNTIISWGATNPTITEVKPSGEVVLELSLPPNIFSYRVFKTDWEGLPVYKKLRYELPPAAFKLDQNYPNPFNPVTSIPFELPEPSYVDLSVYDITGRFVRSIVNSELDEGFYTYQFNSSGISSGIYFYKLKTNKYFETKKMVIIK